MEISEYHIVYTLGNLLMTYVIYQYMHVFYSARKVSFRMECISYTAYFICITLTYTFCKIPLVILLVNIVLFLLLTLLYEGNLKKSLLSVATIYISLMLTETIFFFLTSTLSLNIFLPAYYESEFGLVLTRIAFFVLVRCVNGFKNVKTDVELPKNYWISLLAIPLATVFMLFCVFMNEKLPRGIITGCISCAFLINILSFYLYDRIAEFIKEKIEIQVTKEQNRFYEYQVQMMKDSLDRVRILRHDMKNRLTALYLLAQEGNTKELMTCLEDLTEVCSQSNVYAHSGNVTVDSIINYKLQKANEQNIRITSSIVIPMELPAAACDFAIILGNLLDNALEAVSYVDAKNRWIDIKMEYSKGRLFLSIRNSFDGTIVYHGKKIASRKGDQENHGLGIKSAEAALKKYNGLLQLSHEGKTFEAKLLMYV